MWSDGVSRWFGGVSDSVGGAGLTFLCLAINTGCPEPTPLFDYAWGKVLFFMLAFCNVFVALMMFAVVAGFVTRLWSPSWWLARTFASPASAATPFAQIQKAGLSRTSLTVLVPAYLPNEQAILGGTVRHILEKLEYDYPFRLIVCYNTPTPLPAVEAQLQALERQTFRQGRSVLVLKVEGSTSKAENLNAALDLVDTERLVIYDADHHPDPYSLLMATAHMEYKSCSCVQGSTYLRELSSLLAVYVNAEFFSTHFVFFPALEFMASFGVFGGSNALWKTADLRLYQFRSDVQTEDIELSARAQLGGKIKISFCPESRSGELPPATIRALYKQRLRWALGWDQVTLQHTSHIWGVTSFTCLQKFGFYWLLPLRWALLFSATLNALVTPIVTFWFHQYNPTAGLGGPIETSLTLNFGAYLITAIALVTNCMIHEPVQHWPAIIFFMASGSLYIGWQLMLVIISLTKIVLKADSGWEVTARMVTTPAEATASALKSGGSGYPEGGIGAPSPANSRRPSGTPSLGSPLSAVFSREDLAGSKAPPQDISARDAKISWAWLPPSIVEPPARSDSPGDLTEILGSPLHLQPAAAPAALAIAGAPSPTTIKKNAARTKELL